MKSWRTTLLGIICLGCAAWSVADIINREAWNFRYWLTPIALVATGLIGIHSRDHKHGG